MSGIKRGGDFRRVAKLRAIGRIRILPIAISAIISWPVKTTGAAPITPEIDWRDVRFPGAIRARRLASRGRLPQYTIPGITSQSLHPDLRLIRMAYSWSGVGGVATRRGAHRHNYLRWLQETPQPLAACHLPTTESKYYYLNALEYLDGALVFKFVI